MASAPHRQASAQRSGGEAAVVAHQRALRERRAHIWWELGLRAAGVSMFAWAGSLAAMVLIATIGLGIGAGVGIFFIVLLSGIVAGTITLGLPLMTGWMLMRLNPRAKLLLAIQSALLFLCAFSLAVLEAVPDVDASGSGGAFLAALLSAALAAAAWSPGGRAVTTEEYGRVIALTQGDDPAPRALKVALTAFYILLLLLLLPMYLGVFYYAFLL